MIGCPDIAVWAVLKAAGDALKVNTAASDALWAGLLRQQPEAVRDSARNAYRAKPPTIKRGWARTKEVWPVVSVVLSDDSLHEQFLGFDSHPEADPTTGLVHEVKAMHTMGQVSVFAHAEGSLEAYEIWLVMRQVMLVSLSEFDEAGFDSMSYSGSRDLSPQDVYLPENVWSRVQVWQLGGRVEAHAGEGGALRSNVWLARDDMDRGDGVMGGVVAVSIEDL